MLSSYDSTIFGVIIRLLPLDHVDGCEFHFLLFTLMQTMFILVRYMLIILVRYMFIILVRYSFSIFSHVLNNFFHKVTIIRLMKNM